MSTEAEGLQISDPTGLLYRETLPQNKNNVYGEGQEKMKGHKSSGPKWPPTSHYLQDWCLPLQATVVTALFRVRVALHPVTGGCGGHSCHGHDSPGLFILVPVTATNQVSFGGLTVRGAHWL